MDFETGEAIQEILNNETGEKEYTSLKYGSISKKKPFKVPSSCIKAQQSTKQTSAKATAKYKTDFFKSITFLLPTVVLFNSTLIMILILIEAFLHIWFHRKNEKLKQLKSNVYYQSPLHLITREFCGKCKEDTRMKITTAQDMQKDKKCSLYAFEFLKRALT